MVEKVLECVPREEVFGYTGIQFMQINSLYQLYAMKLAGSPALAAGAPVAQHARPVQLLAHGGSQIRKRPSPAPPSSFNPAAMSWATELLHRVDLPDEFLCPLIPPGTLLGKIVGPPYTPVYATAGHDTASAVAAVPAEGGRRIGATSAQGTWSLMGLEMDRPVIDEQSLALNFTNEVGAGGRIRLLKNIAGLWLLQECRRAWSLEGAQYSYEQLTHMAAEASPFAATINPDAFLEARRNASKNFHAHCRNTAQRPPESHAEYARTILESLALRYRHVIESLETLGKRKIEVIHIVGGGSRNALLNQFVADCTGRRVVAGPSEATAIGNILVQAMGAGELGGLDDVRAVVRRSFAPVTVEPRPSAEWERAYERYRAL